MDALRRTVRVAQTARGTWGVVQGVLWLLAAGVVAVVLTRTLPWLPREVVLSFAGTGVLWGGLCVLSGVRDLRRARALTREPWASAGPWDHHVPGGMPALREAIQGRQVTPGPTVVVLRSTSLRGPVVLTALGAAALVGAVVCSLVAAVAGVGAAVTADPSVVGLGGRPGASVLASAPAPGTASVELAAGERYGVHVVVPAYAVGDDVLVTTVRLVAPSGGTVVADGVVTRPLSRTQSWAASSIHTFTPTESGRYLMTVPDVGVPGAWAAVAPAAPVEDVVAASGGVAIATLAVFAAGGLWISGPVMILAGVAWGAVRLLVRWGARRRPGVADAGASAVSDAT